MNDIEFFKMLHNERSDLIKKLLKEYRKEEREGIIKNVTRVYHKYFDKKFNPKYFKRHCVDKQEWNDYLVFYAQRADGVICRGRVEYNHKLVFDKTEFSLFSRLESFTRYLGDGTIFRQKHYFENSRFINDIAIKQEFFFDSQGNITKTIDHDLPFSFEELANMFWKHYELDLRRRFFDKHKLIDDDAPLEEKIDNNKYFGISLNKYFEKDHPFWIIAHGYEFSTLSNLPLTDVTEYTIIKIDGITGQEIFHKPMLPEDEAIYFSTSTSPQKNVS
ncbi:hypothetical protein [Capnocytophaga canis]|uniref:hypothetical protein n=1 Tax=Capnocytophaga canis TaxID=1848903 RepID=UPI001562522E|nr:hypothetical protein [Capnocytophaga canis]